MQLMAGGAGKSGAPAGPPPGGAPGTGPAGAPMSGPQPAEGDRQNAMITISLAMDLLEQALPPLGSESDDGQTVLDALNKLGKKFGTARSKSQDLIPAELAQLMAAHPQMGGMSPEAKSMGQQPAIPMPGGMPPGAMPH
jgi:hypothetical protein